MNPIEQVQTDFAERLRSLEYFSDIAVGAPRIAKDGDRIITPKQVNEQMDLALAGTVTTGGKVGACVRVLSPGFTTPKRDLPGPQGDLLVPARVQIHPIYNFGPVGTQKYITDIGVEVMRAAHGFRTENVATFFCEEDTLIPGYSEETGLMTLDVLIKSKCQLGARREVAIPTLGVSGLTITLTNVTSGADIYYTLDGFSFPRPGNAQALHYTTPFAVASGTIVRWAAYQSGLHGSNVGCKLITS